MSNSMRMAFGLLLTTMLGPCFGAETLTVKVLVKVREKPNDNIGRPFADVGGFSIRRNNTIYSRARCPDVSNTKGEFVCKIECEPKDGDMRLHLASPGRELARIVAGLSPPGLEAVEVAACKVKTKQPVEVVYRSLDVVISEYTAANPSIYNALTAGGGKSAQVKPFASVAPNLLDIAKDPRNRAALLEFSRLATIFEDAPPERKPSTIVSENLAQYANGLNSVVLRATVADLAGPQTGDAVKVSADAGDFYRSVAAVEKRLNAKPVLNEREIDLANAVREIRVQPKQTPDRLEKIGIEVGRSAGVKARAD